VATALGHHRASGSLTLSLLGIGYTLYLGREIILPIVVALILKLLLQPATRFLQYRLRLPETLAAALVILSVFGVLAAVGGAISLPDSSWVAKAPETLRLLEERISILRRPIDYLQETLKQVETATTLADRSDDAPTVAVKEGGGLAAHLFAGTATTLSRFFTTMVVLFFLLASGDRLLRAVVAAPCGASPSSTKRASPTRSRSGS
jgi:predicted PurR-regulated permease PerM